MLSATTSPPATPPGSEQTCQHLLFLGGTEAHFLEFRERLIECRPGWGVEWLAESSILRSYQPAKPVDAVVIHESFGNGQDITPILNRRFPHSRIIALRAALTAHAQPKPESGSNPVETAPQAVLTLAVAEWKARPAVQALLAKLKTLPTLPQLHLQITRELQSPEGSLEQVSQYVRQDPIMAAKFLNVINSASFGLSYVVADPAEAVMYLGAARTRALVLLSGVFSKFDDVGSAEVSAEELWQHSLQVASLAQGVALLETEDPKLAEAAFTAGLLHDIGKLMLAGNLPQMYATTCRLKQHKRVIQTEAERTLLNTDHAELGACLLGDWQLPLPIVEAVAWHHKPSRSFDRRFSVLTAVHAANVMAHECSEADGDSRSISKFDILYLARLGLASHRNGWRDGCGLPTRDETETFETQLRRTVEAQCVPRSGQDLSR